VKQVLLLHLPRLIDIFKQKADQVLRGMASKVSVDGFRKGKVPLSIKKE
jgi:trigger factor